ncbi:hypothetical protein QAD02_010099 [Eretmocerus hayati]|uniref:Uncharacterized protein n=1 Tax=Eretmocerus hayati TaxID=131215 RepID=A0ACC2NBI6_9HYME|nr:hypothetical protein QAD02_010099 [Eretmocerus hayati]
MQRILILAIAIGCLYVSVYAQRGNSPGRCTCDEKKKEYSPVCADNGVTYDSAAKLKCENDCKGQSYTISYYGLCRRDTAKKQASYTVESRPVVSAQTAAPAQPGVQPYGSEPINGQEENSYYYD